MRFAGRVVSWRLKAPDTPDTPPAPGSLHRFYHKPGVSELAVKTAPGWRLSPPRSRPTPTPVRQDSACAGRLRGPQAIQARLQPPARLPPNPRFLVEPSAENLARCCVLRACAMYAIMRGERVVSRQSAARAACERALRRWRRHSSRTSEHDETTGMVVLDQV